MRGALTILVVEDNADARQIVCELIGLLGHAVCGAGDGEQAWQLAARRDFDVLLTDVGLPGMSGVALARKVLGRAPATRIVFATGYGGEELAGIGFAAAVLRKPYDVAELEAALGSPS